MNQREEEERSREEGKKERGKGSMLRQHKTATCSHQSNVDVQLQQQRHFEWKEVIDHRTCAHFSSHHPQQRRRRNRRRRRIPQARQPESWQQPSTSSLPVLTQTQRSNPHPALVCAFLLLPASVSSPFVGFRLTRRLRSKVCVREKECRLPYFSPICLSGFDFPPPHPGHVALLSPASTPPASHSASLRPLA